jgi:hypothetical protein
MPIYISTSLPSGVPRAPKEPRYFIQKLSRQGKTSDLWVFTERPTVNTGFITKQEAEVAMIFQFGASPLFRIQLAEVFI